MGLYFDSRIRNRTDTYIRTKLIKSLTINQGISARRNILEVVHSADLIGYRTGFSLPVSADDPVLGRVVVEEEGFLPPAIEIQPASVGVAIKKRIDGLARPEPPEPFLPKPQAGCRTLDGEDPTELFMPGPAVRIEVKIAQPRARPPTLDRTGNCFDPSRSPRSGRGFEALLDPVSDPFGIDRKGTEIIGLARHQIGCHRREGACVRFGRQADHPETLLHRVGPGRKQEAELGGCQSPRIHHRAMQLDRGAVYFADRQGIDDRAEIIRTGRGTLALPSLVELPSTPGLVIPVVVLPSELELPSLFDCPEESS